MKQSIFLIMLVCTLLANAQTDRLYVYAPGGSAQTFALNDLRKLTFTQTQMTVYSNSIVNIPYENLLVMSFTPLAHYQTDVKTINNYYIKVYVDAGNLIIKSSSEITNLQVYDIFGRTVGARHALPSNTTPLQIPLYDYPAGIYIIKIADVEGKISVHKIIKN